jgi:hypothetical protein
MKEFMGDNDKVRNFDPATATDAEIASAAKRLGLKLEGADGSARKSRSGQVVQRLAHGRTHAVTVETKHSRR